MRFPLASSKDRFFSVAFSLVVGCLFANGFISSSQQLFQLLSPWIPRSGTPWNEIKEMSFFPLLAALFWLSLPRRSSEMRRFPTLPLFQMSLLPVAIAFFFGRILGNDLAWNFNNEIRDTFWYLLFIPFGEECLFRGWLYGLLDRVWPDKLFTAINPLPIAVWGSAIAFSVWHMQNFVSTPPGLVLLQISYTLITGLWLGVIRSKTGQIWPCVVAHSLINFAAGS